MLGVVLVGFLVAVAGVFLLPAEKIAQLAADQVAAQTGRELRIEGGVSVTMWPVLGVETGPVTLANADWAGPEPMLTAQGLAIGVSAPELLSGTIRVTRIVADAPVVSLATAADGRRNWGFVSGEPAAGDARAPAQPVPITLERIRLTDARVRYAAAGAAPVALGPLDLTLLWPDPQGAADLTARLTQAGTAIDITARIAAMREFLAGQVSPVTARAAVAGATLTFDGRASTAAEAAGRIAVDSPDTGRLLAALGQGAVGLPKGLGRAAHLSAEATYTADGRLSLRDLAVTLDQNRLTGAADLSLAGKPRITAQLAAGDLDFSALGGSGGAGGGGSAAAASGWSRAPIDASALALADGTIHLTAQGIDAGGLRLGPTKAQLTLDKARAVLELTPATVFGGTLNGRLVANNRKGLSVSGNLRAENVETAQLLGDLTGISRLLGTAQGSLNFLGAGGSVDAIMRSLSGKGRIDMGRGVISGIDLDKLLRSGVVTGGTTVFDSLKASYTIKDGNLRNDDLLLILSSFRVEGAGRVGLGARDIDYLVTPVAFRSDANAGLSVPVRIKGPWAAPAIRPDLDAATKAKLEQKKEELEQKAKQELAKKLKLPVDDGQDPEDALRKKLEEEAAKSLKKLLGGN